MAHPVGVLGIYPLDFGTAIKGLLAVKWPPEKKKSRRS
jgi:hypothetical protein